MMEDVTVYWFEGNPECDACSSMTGLYHEAPNRPHSGCQCPVEQGEVRAEKIGESRDLYDSYELLEPIGWLPKGGTESFEKNWSTESSYGGSGEVGGSAGGFDFSFSGEASGSSSEGGANTVTFNYDDEAGGDRGQLVMAVYDVRIWRVTILWRAHWSEGQGMDHEFETWEHEEERHFAGYQQEGF